MKLITVDQSYNEKLIKNFYTYPVGTSPIMHIERTKDFFAPYRILSDDFETCILVNDKEQILAMMTLIFRKAWIQGKKTTVGYVTDFRVSSFKEAHIYWAEHYLDFLEVNRKKRNCNYIFSIVTTEQEKIYNKLIRPLANKNTLPRYYLLNNFDFVNIHGLFPFPTRPLEQAKIENATQRNKQELFDYILENRKYRPISFAQSIEDVAQQIDRWTDLNIEDFLIARDYQGKIAGCVAPWSNKNLQQIRVTQYNSSTRAARESLQFYSYIGDANQMPLPGGKINPVYLTHLYARHPEVLYSFLYHCQKNSQTSDLLNYSHFNGHLLTTPHKSFIRSKISCGLYLILSPQNELPNFAQPSSTQDPPDFELAHI